MAVEARRRCGYRKVGGIYLVDRKGGMPCDRLPWPLTVCPCCSAGFKQSRGFTWVDVPLLVGGIHQNCGDEFPCPLCMAVHEIGRAGLLWIGAQFYPAAEDFEREAQAQGISRRLAKIPRGFKVGETWVLLAHPRAVACPKCKGSGLFLDGESAACTCKDGRIAGMFRVCRPQALEIIITQSQTQDSEFMVRLRKMGLTPVVVPDGDKDHLGSVYDDSGEGELELEQ